MKIRNLLKRVEERGIVSVGAWFGISNPFSSAFETLSGTLGKAETLMNFATGAAALVAVVMLIYGGYTFITAGGDADMIENGNKMITAAIIGLVIVFIARLIISFVINEVIF